MQLTLYFLMCTEVDMGNCVDLCDCPFCGMNVELATRRNSITDIGAHYIECSECGCFMEERFFLGNYARKNTEDEARKRIFEKWNERAK